MKKNSSLIFSVFILFLLITSCGSSDRKEIEDVLSKRKKALETKNLELYLSCISPTYREEKNGQVIGVEEVKRNFLSNVSIFDQIKISYSDRTIYYKGESADVAQKTAVEVRIEKEEGHFLLKENLGFEKVKGRWKIVKDSDADFLKGFVFGGMR